MNRENEILIVEDSPTQAVQLQFTLERHNFPVLIAQNGFEALALLKDTKPALIISDIIMPEMDGFELCRKIKADEKLNTVPVILLTSLSGPDEIIKGLASGASHFIIKPYGEEYLLSQINSILANSDLLQNQPSGTGDMVLLAGKKYSITSDRSQIMNLLFSTYEGCLFSNRELDRVNQELREAQKELQTINQQLEEKVLERTEKITHLNQVLNAIRNVNQLIVKETDQDPLLQGTCEILATIPATRFVWIALWSGAGRILKVAGAGFGADFLPVAKRLEQGELTQCAGRVMAQTEAVVILDPATECAGCPLAVEFCNKAVLSVRLAYNGRVFGQMTISIPEELALDTEENVLFDEVAGDLGYALNALELRERHSKAEKERTRMVTAIEQVADSIVITDRNGTIQFVNPAFEKITGHTREEAVGKNPRILKSDKQDREFYKKMWDTISSGKMWKGHLINRRKDGAFFEEEASISPIKDTVGNIVNYVAVKRDVTHEVKLEKQFREAQKMEAIGTLAGGIAHDFNNILVAVIGYSELALNAVSKEDELYSHLTYVLEAGSRAKQLVNQILTFSRRGEEEKTPIQIGPIIEEAVKLIRASLPSTIEVRQKIEPNVGNVLADSTQVHQVLMNLCTNAAHAMEEDGGKLKINLSPAEPDSKELDSSFFAKHPALKPGSYLVLTVSDSGCGMEPEVMERIFEPYFTTKEKDKGTGLGLSVVHGIIRNHDGTIEVSSKPGKGTTFHVYLPTLEKEPIQESETTGPLATGNEHVLLVDDEEAVLDLEKQILEYVGYHVITRKSAIKALKLFLEDPQRFDLVITDMTMPKMTGEKLAKELMIIRPDLPIILCTGFSEKITAEKAAAMGIQAFVMKPILLHEIAGIVRRVLDKKIALRS